MVTVDPTDAPALTSELASDRKAYSAYWLAAREKGSVRASRDRFLGAHAAAVYDELTARRTRFVRVDELCRRAAEAFPGLVPTEKELEAEGRVTQSAKQGVEIDQGIFLSRVLADPASGLHLCHAMLLPR